MPSTIRLAGRRVRRAWSAIGSISVSRATPAATVFFVPPISWMVLANTGTSARIGTSWVSWAIWLSSQPRPSTTNPAKLGWVR